MQMNPRKALHINRSRAGSKGEKLKAQSQRLAFLGGAGIHVIPYFAESFGANGQINESN